MTMFIFLFLAVVAPITITLIWGPKLLLIQAVWILAATMSIIAGIAFISGGGFSTVFGLFLIGSAVGMTVRIIRPHFYDRMIEVRKSKNSHQGLASWMQS